MPDPDVVLDQLTDNSQRQAQILADLQIGDEVEIDWGAQGGSEKHGTVIQVTSRLVRLQHPNGYPFSISHHHLCCGVKFTAIKRTFLPKEAEPMSEILTEYQVMDNQVEPPVAEPVATAPIEPEIEVTTKVQIEVHTEPQTNKELHIPKGVDWKDVLTRDKYLALKLAGKTDPWMAAICGVKYQKLAKWKAEHGLKGVKLTPAGTLYFPEEPQAASTFEPPARVEPENVVAGIEFRIEPADPEPDFNTDHVCQCGGKCHQPAKVVLNPDDLIKQPPAATFPIVKSNSFPLSLTVFEAAELDVKLTNDIDCAHELLAHHDLTSGVEAVINDNLVEWQIALDKIRSHRVVLD